MQLRDYLLSANETYAGFARRIGVSNAKVVARYAKGERIPDRLVMPRIVAATAGAVQPNDFFDAPAAEQPSAALPPSRVLP